MKEVYELWQGSRVPLAISAATSVATAKATPSRCHHLPPPQQQQQPRIPDRMLPDLAPDPPLPHVLRPHP